MLQVFLNGEDKGSYFFLQEEDKSLLANHLDLKTLGLTGITEAMIIPLGQRSLVRLSDLEPKLHYRIDIAQASVIIDAEPELFPLQVIDYSDLRQLRVPVESVPSAFLNYSVSHSAEVGQSGINHLQSEIGVQGGQWLAFSSSSFEFSDDNEDHFVRLMSNLTRDQPEQHTRLILGDYSDFSGLLGGGGLFAGISYGSEFSLVPYQRFTQGSNFSGVATTTSDLEVYANGQLVAQEHLSPGRFDLNDVLNRSGAADVELVITDAFGNQSRLQQSIYSTTVLLKKGVHDYSYSIGARREDFGSISNSYDEPAFLGRHRMGISETFTGGFRGEASNDLLNLGLTIDWLAGRYGEITTAVLASQAMQFEGNAGFFRYNYLGKYWNFSVAGSAQSRRYAHLNLDPLDDKLQTDINTRLGYWSPVLGSVSLSYNKASRWIEDDSDRLTLSYSRRLSRRMSFFASAVRTRFDQEDKIFTVGLIATFAGGKSAGINSRFNRNESDYSAYLNKNPPIANGLGYNLLVNSDEDVNGKHQDSLRADAQYRADKAVYRLNYFIPDASPDTWRGSIAGAIAYVDGSVLLSRPIFDSFALVRIPDSPDIRVRRNHQVIGRTNKAGEILIPEISAFVATTLSVDLDDIPINLSLDAVDQKLAVPFRGAGLVEFATTKLQAIVGTLFIVEQGKRTAANYWGLELISANTSLQTPIGKGGEFYLENLPAGNYEARAFFGDKTCLFELTIPQSDASMIRLQEVTCEIP